MDVIRDFLARNRTSKVVWCDAVFVVPVTWYLDVADAINPLCVLDVPKDEVGTGLDPYATDVRTRRDFGKTGRWSPKSRSPASEEAKLRTTVEGPETYDVLVSCFQDRPRYPDDKRLFGGELRV